MSMGEENAKYTEAAGAYQKAVEANLPDDTKMDNPKLLTKAKSDGLVKLKDIEHTIKKKVPHGKNSKNTGKIMALAWGPNPDDVRMGVVDQLGSLFVWDTNKIVRMYGFNYPFAQSLAISPDVDNPMVLVGGMRNATVLYKKEAGTAVMKEAKTWVHHDGYISSVYFLGGNKYISSGGDAEIRLFDITAPQTDCLAVLRGHEKDCQSIKFPRDDPSKNVFITCSSDKTVKMWDIRAGACTQSFRCNSELNACSIFPNGNMIAAGGELDKTYVFDVRAGCLVNRYARNNMKTAACEFSKSGRELFVGHDDGAVIVWDIFGSGDNKMYAKKYETHTTKDENGKPVTSQSRVQVLDVGPNGFLASGGFDGTVCIWGAPNEPPSA